MKQVNQTNAGRPIAKVIKATLYHLNGVTSEIKMQVPVYTIWGEPSEIAANCLRNYIASLTQHFIQISAYQISMGGIYSDGRENYSITYSVEEIPLDKVYHNGEWVDPATIKRHVISAHEWNVLYNA